ncbi:histidine phosphatase family protein [Novosphingobium sp. 9]|uniref:histidine phosphatase family protein n=1 Tax=Novosphingobium sp. 9 TaxID=2025349 RepID=UPI0021B51311|nr:histidine phosphatase family protein [Novosphingobium sp. 9]
MSGFLVHLLRHGAPPMPGLLLGHRDPPVTPEGMAACLARVPDLSFAAVASSNLQRCAATAQQVAQARGLSCKTDPRWRELDFGDWDGQAPDQVDPTALAAFHADPDGSPPPQGERWSALVARVGEALAALPARDTLVVTHAGAIRAALAAQFGFAQGQLWAFDLPYASVLTLRVWEGAPRMAQIVGLIA